MINQKDQLDLPIKITVSWFYQSIYLLGMLASACMTILALLSPRIIGFSFCSGIFFLVLVYVYFLSRSTIQVDHHSLVITAPHGIYKIDWNEVETIETDNVAFAFLGKDKYLSMNLTMAGSEKQKQAFYDFLNRTISERNIQVKPLASIWIFQKNTKIRGFGLRL